MNSEREKFQESFITVRTKSERREMKKAAGDDSTRSPTTKLESEINEELDQDSPNASSAIFRAISELGKSMNVLVKNQEMMDVRMDTIERLARDSSERPPDSAIHRVTPTDQRTSVSRRSPSPPGYSREDDFDNMSQANSQLASPMRPGQSAAEQAEKSRLDAGMTQIRSALTQQQFKLTPNMGLVPSTTDADGYYVVRYLAFRRFVDGLYGTLDLLSPAIHLALMGQLRVASTGEDYVAGYTVDMGFIVFNQPGGPPLTLPMDEDLADQMDPSVEITMKPLWVAGYSMEMYQHYTRHAMRLIVHMTTGQSAFQHINTQGSADPAVAWLQVRTMFHPPTLAAASEVARAMCTKWKYDDSTSAANNLAQLDSKEQACCQLGPAWTPVSVMRFTNGSLACTRCMRVFTLSTRCSRSW